MLTEMREIVLEDLLRRDWSGELLRYPFAGENPVHVVDDGRQRPAQVWHDPAGESYVCLVADLAALERRTLAVGPGAAPAATDLAVTTAGDRVALRTSRFGIELPLGSFTGAEVPAPVTGLWWTDGTAFGGGRWFGDPPARLEARLTARGPVLAEVVVEWAWADGTDGRLRVELAAGDCRALWESWSGADRPQQGWDLSIAGLGELALTGIAGKWWKDTWGIPRGTTGTVTLADKWVGTLTNLSPWQDWWDDQAQIAWDVVAAGRGPVLQAASCAVGDWVEPDPPGTFAPWEKRTRKFLPLRHDPDGDICLRVDMAGGWRKWLFGAAGTPLGRRLDTIKDYVLDWPDERDRPFLFVDADDLAARRRPVADPYVRQLAAVGAADLDAPYRYGVGPGQDKLQNTGDDRAIAAWLLTGSAEVAAQVHLVERLRRRLDWLGDFDLMRYTTKVVLFFDLVAGSEVVAPAERRIFRAQMAYLGYLLADPETWSAERGYRSGNLNMTVCQTLNLGMVASAIPDHPAAGRWAAYVTARAREWLLQHAGPRGEWPESMHYIHVSTNEYVNYAIAARSAGFADLLAEGLLKRVMLYAAKQHAPPDPRGFPADGPIRDCHTRIAGTRGRTPLGRAGTTGCSFAHYGVLARATVQSDPQFSRVMQWLYRETGWNEHFCNEGLLAIADVYPDRTLPATRPDWRSELFTTSALLCDAVGTDREDYLLFEAGANFTTPGEHGGLMLWFWRGRPLVSRFSGGYEERAEALISNLSRAVPRTPQDKNSWGDSGSVSGRRLTSLPAFDYLVLEGIRGPEGRCLHQYPPNFPAWPPYEQPADPDGVMHWQRQALFVKDAEAGSFLVLRDRAAGTPGAWKLWTLSQTLGAAGESATTGPRQLAGSHFIAYGQHDVDLDVFVASPVDTPRQTLRYRRDYGREATCLQGFVETQDLLHVEVPAGQAAFAALVPRHHDAEPPAFSALRGGRIIRVRRGGCISYIVLADAADEVVAGDFACRGAAGMIHFAAGGTITLSLAAPGEVRAREYGIRSDAPAELEVRDDAATVRIPFTDGFRTLDLSLPGEWRLPAESPNPFEPQLERHGDYWRLHLLPLENRTITLRRRV